MKTLALLFLLAVLSNSGIAYSSNLLIEESRACSSIPQSSNGLDLKERILHIAMSPERNTLAIASAKHVYLVSTATYEIITTLNTHFDMALAVAWSPDGKQIVVSGYLDNPQDIFKIDKVIIWDAQDLKERTRLDDFGGGSLSWSAVSPLIALSNVMGVSIWDLPTNKIIHFSPKEFPTTVAWKPDKTILAGIQGASGYSWLWPLESNEIVAGPQIDGSTVALAWSPDGNYLAMTSSASGTYIYDTDELDSQNVDQGWPIMVSHVPSSGHSLAWSPVNNYLAVGATNGFLFLDLQNGFKPLVLSSNQIIDSNDGIDWEEIAWSKDGQQLFARANNGIVYIWNVPCLIDLAEKQQ